MADIYCLSIDQFFTSAIHQWKSFLIVVHQWKSFLIVVHQWKSFLIVVHQWRFGSFFLFPKVIILSKPFDVIQVRYCHQYCCYNNKITVFNLGCLVLRCISVSKPSRSMSQVRFSGEEALRPAQKGWRHHDRCRYSWEDVPRISRKGWERRGQTAHMGWLAQ